MNKRAVILIYGTDPSTVKMSSMSLALSSKDYYIVVSGKGYKNLAVNIARFRPDIVIIWNVDNADKIIEFFNKWEFSDIRPFFIVTTSYRNILKSLYEYLPWYSYVIFEPVTMGSIKAIINNKLDGWIRL